jgi:hypothetical protein
MKEPKQTFNVSVPNSADTIPFFSAPCKPFTWMSREQFESERDATTPFLQKRLAGLLRQERGVLNWLKRPGLSQKDKQNLKGALSKIRDCQGIVREMMSDWGITCGPDTEESSPDGPAQK